MRAVLRNQLTNAKEIGGQISAGAGKSVRLQTEPITFRDLARFAWPNKTEFFLSSITGADPRTCRRWMAGSNTPPADAEAAVFQEIYRRRLLSFNN